MSSKRNRLVGTVLVPDTGRATGRRTGETNRMTGCRWSTEFASNRWPVAGYCRDRTLSMTAEQQRTAKADLVDIDCEAWALVRGLAYFGKRIKEALAILQYVFAFGNNTVVVVIVINYSIAKPRRYKPPPHRSPCSMTAGGNDTGRLCASFRPQLTNPLCEPPCDHEACPKGRAFLRDAFPGGGAFISSAIFVRGIASSSPC